MKEYLNLFAIVNFVLAFLLDLHIQWNEATLVTLSDVSYLVKGLSSLTMMAKCLELSNYFLDRVMEFPGTFTVFVL